MMKVPAEILQVAFGESSLGPILVARSAKGLCAVLFGASREDLERDLRSRFPEAELGEADAGLQASLAEVVNFLASPGRSLKCPLDLRGTEFQRRVWQILLQIPAGSTLSYAELARRLGQPTATRAVARACAANALAVVVPCHRVVKSDGQLSGYRWGLERKRDLLERERRSLMTGVIFRPPDLG